MGGSDPGNDTAKALSGLAMRSGEGMAIDVVIGSANPQRAVIRHLCEGIRDAELHVQTPHMAQLMTRADIAINGGGSTTWERCVVGLPAIVAVQSSDQIAIAEAVERAGGHRVLGRSEDLRSEDYGLAIDALTSDDLIRMSQISAGLCDGRGAERVATQLMSRSL
jgi:spore coat polysaccharide biosynthesis predicted glycosyltransferase SpsG